MKRVIELIRVSTEGQAADDRASIPAQRAVNRRTCAQYDLEIVRSIEIADVSGASVLMAPEIQGLIQAMQSTSIEGVVTREFSRLMRPENFSDYALLQAFVDSRTILYLPEGPIDLTSKTGRLLGTIRAAIAGLERTEILERVWTAKEEKRRRGELAQSLIVLPWGVGYDNGRWFYKPEAERVREAFRLFLAGQQSYAVLAKMVGVTPRGMHIVMRNPIWTGWRVIDKMRDKSSAGKYKGVNGRQADRRKIARSEEDVIRIRVIDEPLISESDFQTVQAIMDRKQQRHWRCQPEIDHRFTYNGFLTCSKCGEVIHTALARRDYYLCKARKAHTCESKYMGRERLESVLDELFCERLTDAAFIETCVDSVVSRAKKTESASTVKRLTDQIRSLQEKRTRIMDAFFEGVIARAERDSRLATIDRDLKTAEAILLRESPATIVDAQAIINLFAPLGEWAFWSRDQKRSVLSALIPDIRVADYQVDSLGLKPELFSNDESHTDVGYFVADAPLIYLPIGAM